MKTNWQTFLSDWFSKELFKKDFKDLTNSEQDKVMDAVNNVKQNQDKDFPGFFEKQFHVK